MTTDVTIINTPISVTITQADGPNVIIQAPPVVQVLASTVGIQGPPGSNGSPGARYVHTQASALTVWTVPHNLGFRPVVAVFTTGGVEVLGGEVLHLSLNTLTITFDVAFAGSAAFV